YHILADSTQKEGFTIFVSSDEFPEVTTVKNMVDPFRYLLGGKDYQTILDSKDQKKQIESLWIEWIGNKERARKAIKKYYKRVETSNIHFSSHLEGWQSDRGMIYIIYGEPNKIYRTSKAENWIYGEENNPLSLSFDFVKVINPFTDNDYRLLRNDTYKPSYHRSVNAWRDGRIY
ncbi:MAG: GWxTD domain-containing protein, partial [Cryomorphaceae bacterium]